MRSNAFSGPVLIARGLDFEHVNHYGVLRVRLLPKRGAPFTISAVIPAGKHLFPFRTEKLSLPGPMVLGGQPPGRVGRRRFNFRNEPAPSARASLVSGKVLLARGAAARSGGAELLAPVRVSARRRCTRSLDRRVRHEQRGEARLLERVDRVERLGRRRATRTGRAPPSARGGCRASARPCGEPQKPAAVRSAANSRFVESIRWRNAAEIGPRNMSSARSSQPPIRLMLDRHRRQDDERRLHGDVAVVDLRQLVREHALELRRRRARASRPRETATAAPRVPRPGRERPRMRVVEQVQPRLRDPGEQREPLDRRVHHRRRARAAAPSRRPCRARRGRRRTRARRPTSSAQKRKSDATR